MGKQNTVLLVLAVVILTAILIFGNDQRTTEFEKQTLFPELMQNLTSIGKVRIQDHNGILFEGIKEENKWLATHKNNYPADAQSVIALLNELSLANLDEAKTSKPENFGKLGVADISDDDSEAVLVSLEKSGQKWQLLVGKLSTSGTGTYIRIPGKIQSWLTKASLNLPDNDSDWLRDDILDIDTTAISSISRTDKDIWEIVVSQNMPENNDDEQPTSEQQWSLVDLPEDRSLKYPGILKGFAEDLVGLSFSGLQETLPEEANMVSSLSIAMNNGSRIIGNVYRVAEQYYIDFQSEEGNHYWQDWYYQLTSYAGGQLLKSKEDFLAELPEKEVSEQSDSAVEPVQQN